MRNLIITLALLMFLSCGEDTISGSHSHCFKMIISDALPVQFWLNNCETYNEKDACGVYSFCFCQPFECDDEIKIQFTDTQNLAYELLIYSSEVFLSRQIFDSESYANGYVYSLTIMPSAFSPDICDKQIQFKIGILNDQFLQNTGFTSTLSPWTNEGSGQDWAESNDIAVVNLTSAAPTSKYLQQTFSTRPSGTYRITMHSSILSWQGSSGDEKTDVTVQLFRGETPVLTILSFELNSISTVISTDEFEVGESFDRIRVRFVRDDADPNYTAGVDLLTLEEFNISAKSDCIEIKSEHECSLLIEYGNNRDYAGLIYDNQSPETTFFLRIPATFFHEEFPEEDEDIELTSGVQTLNSSMFAQRLLETDYMPYYMHRKLKLVLKHQTVTIDNQNWVKREKYEIDKGNKRYPKKMARVLLNESDFVQRNVT